MFAWSELEDKDRHHKDRDKEPILVIGKLELLVVHIFDKHFYTCMKITYLPC